MSRVGIFRNRKPVYVEHFESQSCRSVKFLYAWLGILDLEKLIIFIRAEFQIIYDQEIEPTFDIRRSLLS